MISRVKIIIRGVVQGVGFRPFIYKLALHSKINGFVYNSSHGVFIEAEAKLNVLNNFISRIEREKPPMAFISGMEFSYLDSVGYIKFEILESKNEVTTTTVISPDIAVCEDCLNEMNDPLNHRYKYPFINCTNCGPRFSIIESLPYDRPNTSMKIFKMCDKCKAEYENPLDRRFHAQPIACFDCGPQIELCDSHGNGAASKDEAIEQTVQKIKSGKIIAIKGLGGFQFLVDALNEDAVNLLRKRKHRDEKPFALMFPTIEYVKEICSVSEAEERLLLSPESPIVLLKRIANNRHIANSVAPDNPYLGVMLPYTPLHHLLLQTLNSPVIATSGNISEEPMCIDENEALETLGNIADYFLLHNRPIVRQVDDSIVRIVLDKEMILRRARGYAPFPVQISNSDGKTILAVGGHLKNSIALKVGENVFVSQYIGDLSTESSFKSFQKVISDFKNLYNIEPDRVVHDEHPEYISTKYAKSLECNTASVQHHYAHVASCRAENQINGSTLGVSWDGTGYGSDGTIWGGEFFISDDGSYSHCAQLKQFPLPGGEKAIKESRRSAIGVLYELYGDEIFNRDFEFYQATFKNSEFNIIQKMLEKNINSPITSSAGRLFDAVSSLLGISYISNYEGQSAMKLEFIVDTNERGHYPFSINENTILKIDWSEIIKALLDDKKKRVDISKIATRFHNSLAQIILSISEIVGKEKVLLSGGCFQNIYLTEQTAKLLTDKKHKVYLNQRVPPNDGGIALGQVAAYNVVRKDWMRNESSENTRILGE
ncbi:MAG: carbamoyltransferase HypF [Melioribacteraceae bacterium]|nr:carbamoyltransferase HypF [Melioribacteraceae bacterium]